MLPIIPKRGETDPPRLRQLTLENFLVIPEPIIPATSPRDVKKREQYYRHNPPLPRDDPRWSGLATLRLSAERAIGRYKAFFCPERVRTRRLPRVKNGSY